MLHWCAANSAAELDIVQSWLRANRVMLRRFDGPGETCSGARLAGLGTAIVANEAAQSPVLLAVP